MTNECWWVSIWGGQLPLRDHPDKCPPPAWHGLVPLPAGLPPVLLGGAHQRRAAGPHHPRGHPAGTALAVAARLCCRPCQLAVSSMAAPGGCHSLGTCCGCPLATSGTLSPCVKLQPCSQVCNARPGGPHSLRTSTHPHHRSSPSPLTQNCIKVSNEPPTDMRSNMRRAWAAFPPAFFERASTPAKAAVLRATCFGLCFFHSVLLGRKKYGTGETSEPRRRRSQRRWRRRRRRRGWRRQQREVHNPCLL